MRPKQLPIITINETTNCTNVIAELIFEHFNVDNIPTRLKGLIGMGQGFGSGSLCGSVAGGLFAINTILAENGATKEQILDAHAKFKDDFVQHFAAVNCAEILDTHFDTPKEYETRQSRFCGSLLDTSANTVIEIVNLAIASINPIMTRFNNL